MESFWSTLKAELLERQELATRKATRLAIFDYVHTFYNRARLHNAIGYQSPVDYKKTLTTNQPRIPKLLSPPNRGILRILGTRVKPAW